MARCRLGLSVTIKMWLTLVCSTTRPAHIRAARRAVRCARRSSVFTLANRVSGWGGSIWYAYTQCRWGNCCRSGFAKRAPSLPGKENARHANRSADLAWPTSCSSTQALAGWPLSLCCTRGHLALPSRACPNLADALSNLLRSPGAVTVLGGPAARCSPEGARRYFDYVLGFTDRTVVREVLEDCAPHRPEGRQLAAGRQPLALPGVRERWKFIAPTIKKAPLFKIVPMLGSLGCPYTCSFCIDSVVPYQPLDLEGIQDDLRFLGRQLRRPRVGGLDPNLGLRFDEFLDAIEAAAPPGSIDFIAESSLSLLSEPHVIRLKRNGFKALLPGVESWFDLGNKSKTGKVEGHAKVEQVSEHVNMILRHIPYVQTNFVLGLDSDRGPEPFELTKRFVDLTPGAFPGYSLLSAFGRAAPLNLQYQRSDRVLPFPFHFLDNNHAMNVKPQNYSWQEFYDHVIDLT